MIRPLSIALLTPALLYGCVDQKHDLGGSDAGSDVAGASSGVAGASSGDRGGAGISSRGNEAGGLRDGSTGTGGTQALAGGTGSVAQATGGSFDPAGGTRDAAGGTRDAAGGTRDTPTGGAATQAGGAGTAGAAGAASEVPCRDLDEEGCDADDECVAIIVLDVGTFVQCVPVGGCAGPIVCASNGDATGSFTEDCVPPDYSIVGSEDCLVPCGELTTPEECGAEPTCNAIVSTDGQFWECRTSRLPCPVAPTCAWASDAAPHYRFPTECVPTGWMTSADMSDCREDACEGLSRTACEEELECNPIVDTAGTYRGCLDAAWACPPTVTCGSDGISEIAEFGGCLPHGWYRVEVEDCSLEAECAALATPDECEAAEDCSPITPIAGYEPVFYCGSRRACPEAQTCATPPDRGVPSLFPTECLPPGWESVDTGCEVP